MSYGKRGTKGEKAVGISIAAEITAVEVYTLRYWEKEFIDFLQPIRTEGGQRRYRPQDIRVVFAIKRLLRDEMFSIAGARKHLEREFAQEAAA